MRFLVFLFSHVYCNDIISMFLQQYHTGYTGAFWWKWRKKVQILDVLVSSHVDGDRTPPKSGQTWVHAFIER